MDLEKRKLDEFICSQPSLIEYANEILGNIQKLVKLSCHEYLKKEMADCYAKELQSSWEIEGEHIDCYIIRSKLVKKLGLNVPEWSSHSDPVHSEKENAALDGSLYLLNCKGPLTLEDLCHTHKILGQSEEDRDKILFYGKLRTCGELVGKFDKKNKIYLATYEGPSYQQVPRLMKVFLEWWENSRYKFPLPIGAALAHLYFVTIHPFHDGNGRMARLLMNKYFAISNEASFHPVNIGATARTYQIGTSGTKQKYSQIRSLRTDKIPPCGK